MEHAEILAMIEAERLDLADFLETLDEPEWSVPSLCPEWTVHEVLAHLTLGTRQTVLPTLVKIARAKGDFHRVNTEDARQRAARFSPAELIAQVREHASSPHRLKLAGRLDPLVDILVHGQDIARPLGRSRAMPVERVLPALDYTWRSAFYGGRKRFRGMRLIATDAPWSAGDGRQEIRGPVAELLMLSTGRPNALAPETTARPGHAAG